MQLQTRSELFAILPELIVTRSGQFYATPESRHELSALTGTLSVISDKLIMSYGSFTTSSFAEVKLPPSSLLECVALLLPRTISIVILPSTLASWITPLAAGILPIFLTTFESESSDITTLFSAFITIGYPTLFLCETIMKTAITLMPSMSMLPRVIGSATLPSALTIGLPLPITIVTPIPMFMGSVPS